MTPATLDPGTVIRPGELLDEIKHLDFSASEHYEMEVWQLGRNDEIASRIEAPWATKEVPRGTVRVHFEVELTPPEGLTLRYVYIDDSRKVVTGGPFIVQQGDTVGVSYKGRPA